MPGDDWARLADAVSTRIEALNITQAQIQQRGGPSPAKVREITSRRATAMSPSKRRDLERALQWMSGSIDNILRGGDPTVLSNAGFRSRSGSTDFGLLLEPAFGMHAAQRGKAAPTTPVGTPIATGGAVDAVEADQDLAQQLLELIERNFPDNDAFPMEHAEFEAIKAEITQARRLLSPMRNVPEVDAQYMRQLLIGALQAFSLIDGIRERQISPHDSEVTPAGEFSRWRAGIDPRGEIHPEVEGSNESAE